MDLGCWRRFIHQLDSSLHWPHYLHTRRVCPSSVPLCWVTHSSCYIGNDHITSGFLDSSRDHSTHCCAWQCCHCGGRYWTMWPTINQLCNTVNKDCVLAQCSVSDMLAKHRKIVGHCKHSHLAAERLQDIQRQFSLPYDKLMQDEPTRWDSTYYMLAHPVEQRRAICLYDTKFELLDRLNSNEWQLAKKCQTTWAHVMCY